MKTIGEIVQHREPAAQSERAQIIKEIYELYTSEQEKTFRKVANWKRYIAWLKENRYSNTEVNQKIFRKSWHFIKELPVNVICIMLSPLSERDLYFVLSTCKDKNHRGESVGAWLISSCNKKNENNNRGVNRDYFGIRFITCKIIK